MKNKNVLLVEDNELNQIYFEEVLSELGFDVIVAGGIANAKKCFELFLFAFVLSDYKLPDGNGVELFHSAGKLSYNKSNFILISGFSKEEITLMNPQMEIPEILYKPIEIKSLKKKLIELNLLVSNSISNEKTIDKYDLSKIETILKNDQVKIGKSVNEYFGILKNANELIAKVKNGIEDEEVLRNLFHDILNLSQFFGGQELYELTFELKNTKDLQIKQNLLLMIQSEIKSQIDFLSTTSYLV